jgi:poly(A) polymerase
VNLLREFGLIEPVLPELAPTFELPQGLPAAPTGTLWEHQLQVLELLDYVGPSLMRRAGDEVSFPLAFAALLHDVGKPQVFARTPDRYTFHHHEQAGKRIVEKIADRLKLSTAEKTRLAWLVEKHQYLADAPSMRLSKLKPILVHPGIGELLALHRADALASGHGLQHVEFCERMLRDMPPAELNPEPVITGDDLIAMGLEPGREFKRLLDAVREAQLEGRVRSKADGLKLATELRQAPHPE